MSYGSLTLRWNSYTDGQGGGGSCYDPPLEFIIFCWILAILVSNKSFPRILHNAENFFLEKLIFDKVTAF